MDCAFYRASTFAFWAVCALASPAFAAAPAYRDNFETAENSWRAGDADVAYRLEMQQRIRGNSHTGQGCERVQISAGAGSCVYFSHEIGTARIVGELCPSVWINSRRQGVQLLARVVLPRTPDPRTGKPITTLISGDKYTTTGSWQQLKLNDTPKLLNQQLRVLKNQLGGKVDPREAYIDLLLLNVYCGQGQSIVDIDDLELVGAVPFESSPIDSSPVLQQSTGGVVLANNAEKKESTKPAQNFDRKVTPTAGFTAPTTTGPTVRKVALTGSVLTSDGKPIFPRIIRSQGEPLAWLKEQGFNTVRFGEPLTNESLSEASRLGLRLVGPPPRVNEIQPAGATPLSAISTAYEPVLAWHLGDRLASAELASTVSAAKQLRQTDRELKRPLVCSADEDLLAYSRQIDLLSAFRFPLGTSIELRDYGAWLRERPRLARPGTPLWTVVQTEMAPAVVDQVSAILGPQQTETAIDPDSLRVLAYQAFCSGARGIEFASESRLDAADINTRIRATALALINLEMELLEPWGAAGNYATTARSNDSTVTGVVLSVDSAKLVIAMRSPKNSQFIGAPEAGGTSLPPMPGVTPMRAGRKATKADDPTVPNLESPRSMQTSSRFGQQSGGGGSEPPAAPQIDQTPSQPGGVPTRGNTTLIVPGIPEGHSVYELTPAEIRPLRHRRVEGGTAIAIEDFSLVSLVLVTPDPLVKSSISRRIAENLPRAARLQRELSALMLAQLENTSRRFVGQTQLPPSAMSLAATRADLQRADQLLATGDNMNAYFAARNAMLPIGRWKRETWLRAVTPLSSPIASPLAVSFNTLPEHLRFMATTARSPASENKLVGGDAEDLSSMLQAGWRHFEHPQAEVNSSVELSPLAPFNGNSSLRLQARSAKPDAVPTVIESAPLWIASAPVRVVPGDIVCIHGQVRVPTPITGSVDGLMIVDSLGGEALAERMGQTNGWREFTMYRAATKTENLTLSFALTGLGEAWIDDVTVRFIRRGEAGIPGGAFNSANLPAAGNPNPTAAQQPGPMFAPPSMR